VWWVKEHQLSYSLPLFLFLSRQAISINLEIANEYIFQVTNSKSSYLSSQSTRINEINLVTMEVSKKTNSLSSLRNIKENLMCYTKRISLVVSLSNTPFSQNTSISSGSISFFLIASYFLKRNMNTLSTSIAGICTSIRSLVASFSLIPLGIE